MLNYARKGRGEPLLLRHGTVAALADAVSDFAASPGITRPHVAGISRRDESAAVAGLVLAGSSAAG